MWDLDDSLRKKQIHLFCAFCSSFWRFFCKEYYMLGRYNQSEIVLGQYLLFFTYDNWSCFPASGAQLFIYPWLNTLMSVNFWSRMHFRFSTHLFCFLATVQQFFPVPCFFKGECVWFYLLQILQILQILQPSHINQKNLWLKRAHPCEAFMTKKMHNHYNQCRMLPLM